MNFRNLKTAAKRTAEIITANTAPLLWKIHSQTLLVLMYHRVLPPGDIRLTNEQPGMYVYPETFRLHLATLKKFFQPVRLDDWIRAARENTPLPDKAVAITFDDGWKDNFEHAYPVLADENVPATIFLVSDMIGTDRLFWPERLAAVLRQGLAIHGIGLYSTNAVRWLNRLRIPMPASADALTPEVLDRIINRVKVLDDLTASRNIEEMATCLGTHNYPSNPEILNWEQVREMVRSGLISVGSHTRRHTRMSEALSADCLYDEIVESRHIIERNVGCEVNLFCYPNGDTTTESRSLVSRHYLGACSTVSGWHAINADRFMIRRIGLHQDIARDETSFLARLSGWL
ncbi:MAG: polysaccharide deacetylase family protein [Acidiferrobacterales bacterium]